jgi:hypothetical protein
MGRRGNRGSTGGNQDNQGNGQQGFHKTCNCTRCKHEQGFTTNNKSDTKCSSCVAGLCQIQPPSS